MKSFRLHIDPHEPRVHFPIWLPAAWTLLAFASHALDNGFRAWLGRALACYAAYTVYEFWRGEKTRDVAPVDPKLQVGLWLWGNVAAAWSMHLSAMDSRHDISIFVLVFAVIIVYARASYGADYNGVSRNK